MNNYIFERKNNPQPIFQLFFLKDLGQRQALHLCETIWPRSKRHLWSQCEKVSCVGQSDRTQECPKTLLLKAHTPYKVLHYRGLCEENAKPNQTKPPLSNVTKKQKTTSHITMHSPFMSLPSQVVGFFPHYLLTYPINYV